MKIPVKVKLQTLMKAGLCLWDLREMFYFPRPRAQSKTDISCYFRVLLSDFFSTSPFIEGIVSQEFYLYVRCVCTGLSYSSLPPLAQASSSVLWSHMTAGLKHLGHQAQPSLTPGQPSFCSRQPLPSLPSFSFCFYFSWGGAGLRTHEFTLLLS